MVTKVGLQTDFMAALKDLVELEYDTVEAYQAAINRIESEEYLDKLREFKKDHLRHITELTNYLQKVGETAPTGADLKSLLTQGKVVIMELRGDKGVLLAMKSNEEETNRAYERLNEFENISPEVKELLERNLQDERRHFAWLNSITK